MRIKYAQNLTFFSSGKRNIMKSDLIHKMVTTVSQFLKWIRVHLEFVFWVSALLLLFFLPEGNSGPSLCVFRYLGFTFCPGCGIGHSIHDALHFRFTDSFHHHPLGIIAVFIIFNRIIQLRKPIKQINEA